ncbi:MAG: hypothetical protein PHZ26_04690 [Candidatus Gracilibacteria bacterium]|nr:hypothetical protein [Candidatus Gracilibacteria bacterium]MDD2909025.1 hypothetical protein [Candidatus Gracilibacteria bacterium]
MELFVNTETKACNINPIHVVDKGKPDAEILTLSVSDEIYRILTVKLNYPEYLGKIDELIKGVKIASAIN